MSPLRKSRLPSPVLGAALLLAGCHAPDHSGPAHLAKARDLLARHETAAAETEVAAALKADPRNRDAHFLAGQIHEALGDVRSAFADFVRADMLDRTDYRARIKSIELLIGAGELDAAIGRINVLLADDPHNLDALAYRAFAEQERDDFAKARRDAQAVLVDAPAHPVANAVLALLALRDKNTDLALADIQRGFTSDPGNVRLAQVEAAVFLQLNARDRAVNVYRQLVDAHPGSARLRLALAELQAADRNTEAGEATLRDGVAAAPQNQQMRLGFADYLQRHERPEAAEAILRAGIKIAPDDSVYDRALAANFAQRGQADHAVAVAKDAVNRLKDGSARTDARIELARLTIAEGDFGAARKVLDDVIQTNPDNDTALMLRAEVLRPDETERAITDLLAVTARRPDDPRPFEMLARAYLTRGKSEEALAAARRVADLLPGDQRASARLAELALALGKAGEARAALDGFVARNPASLDGRAAVVRFAMSKKDWAGAETALDALRALPDAENAALELGAEIKEGEGKPAEAADLYRPLLDKASTPALTFDAARGFVRAALAATRGPEALARLQVLRQGQSAAKAEVLDIAIASLQGGLGQVDAAGASYDAAIRDAPTDTEGYLQKSAAFVRLKQVDAALAALDAGVAAGAPKTALLLAKAVLQQSGGAVDAAAATYRAVLDDTPGNMVAANNLASLLADRKPLDRGRLTAARDAIRKYTATGDPNLLDTIGWADYRLGDLSDAKDLLARAHADTSRLPVLRFHYGAVLIAAGEKAAGQALIRTVLDKTFTGKSEAQSLVVD